MLHDRGIFTGDRDPQHVFDLISLDQEVVTCLFDLIRQAELNLRNRTVDFFCSNGDPTSYLDESHLEKQCLEIDERQLVSGMLKEIFRYGEDFVIRALEEKAKSIGKKKPKRYSPQDHDLCLTLASDLPIWSVIDSFSLGQLGKFVMACDAHVEDYQSRTWRQLADSLGMKAKVFSSGIESLSNTRNLICHHARLWMRPANHSPKKPKMFEKQLRGVDPKSQLMAFANVAHFQQTSEKRAAFQAILDLVESNKCTATGSRKPRTENVDLDLRAVRIHDVFNLNTPTWLGLEGELNTSSPASARSGTSKRCSVSRETLEQSLWGTGLRLLWPSAGASYS